MHWQTVINHYRLPYAIDTDVDGVLALGTYLHCVEQLVYSLRLCSQSAEARDEIAVTDLTLLDAVWVKGSGEKAESFWENFMGTFPLERSVEITGRTGVVRRVEETCQVCGKLRVFEVFHLF